VVRVKRDGTWWRSSLDGERVFWMVARRCSRTTITIRLGFTLAFEEKRYATARGGVDRFFFFREKCRSFHSQCDYVYSDTFKRQITLTCISNSRNYLKLVKNFYHFSFLLFLFPLKKCIIYNYLYLLCN